MDACTERLAGSLRDLFFCQSDVLFPLKELMEKGKGRLQEEQVTQVFLSSRSIIYVNIFSDRQGKVEDRGKILSSLLRGNQ